MILYHYTCADAAPRIAASGRVRPHPAPPFPLGIPLAWFTDLAYPDRNALRLTSKADWRVTVEASGDITWWPEWRRVFVRDLNTPACYRDAARALELATGAQPVHWWVATMDVPILKIEPTGRD